MNTSLDRAVKEMKTIIEHQEHAIAALEAAVVRLARGETLEEIPQLSQISEALWTCSKCGARLGTYDAQEDVLRIRRNDLYIWIHPGAGGWTRILCRNCGEDNVTQDSRPEPVSDPEAG